MLGDGLVGILAPRVENPRLRRIAVISDVPPYPTKLCIRDLSIAVAALPKTNVLQVYLEIGYALKYPVCTRPFQQMHYRGQRLPIMQFDEHVDMIIAHLALEELDGFRSCNL